MPLERHGLLSEFPEHREKIHQLKTSDNHFARLYTEYDELDHDVRRIEAGAEAASDERLETLKKLRVSLKDRLFHYLAA